MGQGAWSQGSKGVRNDCQGMCKFCKKWARFDRDGTCSECETVNYRPG